LSNLPASSSSSNDFEIGSKATPFLERFTVADLRSWADRKMQVPGL
jgi:hypothetical protein